MATLTVCDRCGRALELDKPHYQMGWAEREEINKTLLRDLCDSCENKLRVFMAGRELVEHESLNEDFGFSSKEEVPDEGPDVGDTLANDDPVGDPTS